MKQPEPEEAGAGFAIVAEEVRNLAQRATIGAHNTSVLIEKMNANIQSAIQSLDQTNNSLKQVVDKTNKAKIYVSEIAPTTDEQAKGIQQITQAMNNVEKVVVDATESLTL